MTNMVNALNNTISPFKSKHSTLTNGNNFLKIHLKELLYTSKVLPSDQEVRSLKSSSLE